MSAEDASFSQESRESFRKPLDSLRADESIDEGRRVYVGNLRYEASVKDIENIFSDIADDVEAINSTSSVSILLERKTDSQSVRGSCNWSKSFVLLR